MMRQYPVKVLNLNYEIIYNGEQKYSRMNAQAYCS
jgi:hypothetical protein